MNLRGKRSSPFYVALREPLASRVYGTSIVACAYCDPQLRLHGLGGSACDLALRRSIAAGELRDMAAVPIFSPHIKDISRAYALKGTPEAILRRLCVLTLWRFAGRSGEAANLNYEALRVEGNYVHGYVDQIKVGKEKPVVFIAAPERHGDWFLALADHLVMDINRALHRDENTKHFVFPGLLPPQSAPAKVMGGYITSLIPGGAGSREYADVLVPSLPKNANAGTLPTASTTLATTCLRTTLPPPF